jgi:SUMO ligase MMS21 Smc5/6 complex component
LPYHQKEITTRELTNRKQIGAYIVPTKGQMTASRKNNKMKYIQMRAYTVPTKPRGPHPDFLCTNQGSKEKDFQTYQDPK